VKHLLGETVPEERMLVQEWLLADPANQAYFDELKKVWDTSLQLAAASKADENKAWKRFRQRVENRDTDLHVPAPAVAPVKQIQFAWKKIAAAIVVLIGLTMGAYWIYNDREVETVIAETTGDTLTERLPDGSMVMLNKASSITYPASFKGNRRPVKLKGEAFFDVTPDKEKPFVISVNDIEVTVVGTSFNIKEQNGNTDVIVETGIVRVTKNGKTVELHPGEQLHSEGNNTFDKSAVTDNLHSYYRSRVFVCDDTPLLKLVKALEEAYRVKIDFKNEEALKNQRINITLQNETIERVMELVSATLNIEITKTDDGYVIED
jgi:ferric-dicitrate binding protein FerR (iron transport regulator)